MTNNEPGSRVLIEQYKRRHITHTRERNIPCCKQKWTDEYKELLRLFDNLGVQGISNLTKETMDISYFEVDGRTGKVMEEYIQQNNIIHPMFYAEPARRDVYCKATIPRIKKFCTCCENNQTN